MAKTPLKFDGTDGSYWVELIKNADIDTECKPGLLADLLTADKTSLVAAINEVFNKLSGKGEKLPWARWKYEGAVDLPAAVNVIDELGSATKSGLAGVVVDPATGHFQNNEALGVIQMNVVLTGGFGGSQTKSTVVRLKLQRSADGTAWTDEAYLAMDAYFDLDEVTLNGSLIFECPTGEYFRLVAEQNSGQACSVQAGVSRPGNLIVSVQLLET